MSTLFLIFNHQLTSFQEEDARAAIGVNAIVNLPAELQELWNNVPPDLPEIKNYLRPIEAWLFAKARSSDTPFST